MLISIIIKKEKRNIPFKLQQTDKMNGLKKLYGNYRSPLAQFLLDPFFFFLSIQFSREAAVMTLSPPPLLFSSLSPRSPGVALFLSCRGKIQHPEKHICSGQSEGKTEPRIS